MFSLSKRRLLVRRNKGPPSLLLNYTSFVNIYFLFDSYIKVSKEMKGGFFCYLFLLLIPDSFVVENVHNVDNNFVSKSTGEVFL